MVCAHPHPSTQAVTLRTTGVDVHAYATLLAAFCGMHFKPARSFRQVFSILGTGRIWLRSLSFLRERHAQH